MNGHDATLAVIDAADAAGVDYMLVGSFSTNLYGVIRSTRDSDFVVACGGDGVRAIVARLGEGFRLDPQIRFESVTGTMRYVVHVANSVFEVELFRLGTDPHDQERFRRRHRLPHPTLGRVVVVPTAEDVVVTKLRWASAAGRLKDREDARNVLAVQKDLLDRAYIRRWTDQHGTTALLDEILRSIEPD